MAGVCPVWLLVLAMLAYDCEQFAPFLWDPVCSFIIVFITKWAGIYKMFSTETGTCMFSKYWDTFVLLCE